MSDHREKISPEVQEHWEEHFRRLRERFGSNLTPAELTQRSFEELGYQLADQAELPEIVALKIYLFQIDDRLGSGGVWTHFVLATTEQAARDLLNSRLVPLWSLDRLVFKRVTICHNSQVIGSFTCKELLD